MNGKDNGLSFGQFLEGGHDVVQVGGIVCIFSAVNGCQQVVFPRQAKVAEDSGFALRKLAEKECGIVHDISNVMHTFGNAFMGEIGYGGMGGAEEQRGDMISQDSIDFLRHTFIKRTQAGLNVSDRYMEFGGRQRAGKRRVRIAIDEHPVGLSVENLLLNLGEHFPCHFAMRTAADVQIHNRGWNAHLPEEDVAHVAIVVLAGMDNILHEDGPPPRSLCSTMARLTMAALMNCGLAPTMARSFIGEEFGSETLEGKVNCRVVE